MTALKPLQMLCLVLLTLPLTACTGAGGGTGNNPLRDAAHTTIPVAEILSSQFITTIIGWVIFGSLCCGLWGTIFSGRKAAFKWVIILLMAGSWIILTNEVMHMIYRSWPEGLNLDLINQTLGKDNSLVSGDQSPWSATFVDDALNLGLGLLQFTHFFVGASFLLLPIIWWVENVVHKESLMFVSFGMWAGLFFARLFTPSVLYGIMRDTAASVNPAQTIENTLHQTNIRFIASWLGGTSFSLLFFMIIFGFVGYVAAPGIGRVVLKVAKEGKEAYDASRKEVSEAAAAAKAEAGEKHGDKSSQQSKQEFDKKTSERKRKARKSDQNSNSNSSVSQSNSSGQPDDGKKKKKGKNKAEQAGQTAEVAGTVATITGVPEVGIPLAAAGGVLSSAGTSTRDPNQDPKVAADQRQADQAVNSFQGGAS